MALITGQATLSGGSTVLLFRLPPGPNSVAITNGGTAVLFIGSGSTITTSNGYALPASSAPLTFFTYPASAATPVYGISTSATVSWLISTDE